MSISELKILNLALFILAVLPGKNNNDVILFDKK
jgi:hypothetical protein